MQILALLLLVALIGAGIYFWVRHERSKLLAKRTKLAEDAGLLNTSGKLSSAAFDRITGQAADILDDDENPDSEDEAGDSATVQDGDAQSALPQASIDTEQQPDAQKTVVFSAKDHLKFQQAAPSIAQLCEKLLQIWSECTKVAWENDKASRARSNAHDELHYRNRRNWQRIPLERATAIEALRVAHKNHRSTGNDMAVAYEKFRTLPAAAKEAWNALTSALAPFSEAYLQTLPPQLSTIGLSAHQVKSVSKSSIEKYLEEVSALDEEGASIHALAIGAIQPTSNSDEQKAALQTAAVEAGKDLLTRIMAAIECLFISEKAVSDASITRLELDALHETRFTPPQKPTPEEVMRYLMSVEDWTISVAAARTHFLDKTAAAINALAEAKTVLSEYTGASQVEGKKLVATQSEDHIALSLALQTVCGDLTASLSAAEKSLMEGQQKVTFKAIPEVVAQTATDQELLKALRLSARTVGFALAQANVASKKLSQMRQDRPDYAPSPPKVERNETFAKHTGLYSQYLKRLEKYTNSVKVANAEIELVETALAARLEKVRETVKTMSQAGAAAVKSFSRTTCDELRVVTGMIEKIAQLNKS